MIIINKLKPNCVVGKTTAGSVRMILKEGLSNEIIDYLRSPESEVDYFDIEFGNWSDLERLLEFKNKINKLSVSEELTDWSVISKFTELKKLTIDAKFKNCNIDFSKLKKLKHMQTYWNDSYDKYLKGNKTLKTLFITNYQGENMSLLGDMENLQYLELYRSRKLKSLQGIEKIKNLNFFEANGCSKLTDVSALTSLKKLKALSLSNCTKNNDYEILKQLRVIDEMYLGGELNSLKWITSIKTLTRLKFDCKLVNGDLSFLYDMPELKHVRFNNKRNYTVKIADIQSYLEDKGYDQKEFRRTSAAFYDGYN